VMRDWSRGFAWGTRKEPRKAEPKHPEGDGLFGAMNHGGVLISTKSRELGTRCCCRRSRTGGPGCVALQTTRSNHPVPFPTGGSLSGLQTRAKVPQEDGTQQSLLMSNTEKKGGQ